MVRRVFYWILLCTVAKWSVGQDFSVSGPYRAGWREITVRRPNNSTFQSLLFYPALRAEQNSPLNPQAGPCPGISFGHGFLVNPDKYRSTFAHLASWGYVVIASRSEGGLFPNHQHLADDLLHCLTWLIAESDNPGSFLYAFIKSDALGLSGHSMGGGASILAASADSRVKAVANLAAANTNPSAVAAMDSVTIPISLITGSDDSIVPVGSHGQLMYNNGHSPKQIPIITGAFHCGFLDSDILFCDSGSISRSQQLAITRHLLTAFFELHLKNDLSVWSLIWGPHMLNDSRWSVQIDPYLPSDLNADLCLTWEDIEAFLPYWRDLNCGEPNWCGGRDMDCNGQINLTDFVLFSQGWLLCY
jgi:dienelactone hydrolase